MTNGDERARDIKKESMLSVNLDVAMMIIIFNVQQVLWYQQQKIRSLKLWFKMMFVVKLYIPTLVVHGMVFEKLG